MERNVKQQLIQSVNAIKNKLKRMREDEDQIDFTMNRVLKPVAEPMKALIEAEHSKKKTSVENVMSENSINILNNSSMCSKYEDFDDCEASNTEDDKDETLTVKQYDVGLKTALERSLNKEDIEEIYDGLNIPFGVRRENNEFLMGNANVNMKVLHNSLNKTKTQVITICNKNYELTPGLKELLMRKTPNLSLVTTKDQATYKDILCDTSAHKRNYNPNGQLKGDRSLKYREIIKPLFLDLSNNDTENTESRLSETKFGGGLPTLKKYKPNTDFIFWDDPNELIERLKILIASRDAGNSNHDNEIISIIEELKEANIIKE